MRRSQQPVGVLYIANSAFIGGGNRVLMEIITRLDRSRFRPAIVSPNDGPLVDWATQSGVPWRVIPLFGKGRLGMLTAAWAYVRAVRGFRAAVVHANSPEVYHAASLCGAVRRVARVCHLHLPTNPEQLEWSFRFGPEAVVTCYSRQAEEVREDLARVRPTARLVAIPNGIDVDAFQPTPAAGDAAFRFGADRVVLIMGHLSEVKGYPTFLRAAAAIRGRLGGQVAFVALGGETIEPGAKARYEALARELGLGESMHFLGWCREVPNIIRAADVVVLPSKLEGLPLSVLEAMSCERPVVATPVNGTPEAVVNDVTGLLVPPDDVDALGRAIVALLDNPERARQMGREGRKRIVERFSFVRQLQQLEQLYSDLLTGVPETSKRLSPDMNTGTLENANNT